MNTPTAIMILAPLAFSGCSSSFAGPYPAKSQTVQVEPTDLDKRQIATILREFPQYGNIIKKGQLKHEGYQQWFVSKLHGTQRLYELWINDDCQLYDRPYTNDGTPIKVPGKDVTITD